MKVERQLAGIAEVPLAAAGERPLQQLVDRQLEFLLALFQPPGLPLQFRDRLRERFDETALLAEQRLTRREVVGNRQRVLDSCRPA